MPLIIFIHPGIVELDHMARYIMVSGEAPLSLSLSLSLYIYIYVYPRTPFFDYVLFVIRDT